VSVYTKCLVSQSKICCRPGVSSAFPEDPDRDQLLRVPFPRPSERSVEFSRTAVGCGRRQNHPSSGNSRRTVIPHDTSTECVGIVQNLPPRRNPLPGSPGKNLLGGLNSNQDSQIQRLTKISHHVDSSSLFLCRCCWFWMVFGCNCSQVVPKLMG
jgi:hypothetical protein